MRGASFLCRVSGHLPGFDFLLKTDLDTLICFNTVTDMLDAAQLRFKTSERLYLGHFETCSQIRHNPHERFYDPWYQEDILLRDDALCYPPYMQGLGYVLSRDLVQTIGAMWKSLKVYTNEDMMVGSWLIGHQVNRARLVARQFNPEYYQTTLSECFPLYYNHKVPSYVMRECNYFHSTTGLCWQPKKTSTSLAPATPMGQGALRTAPDRETPPSARQLASVQQLVSVGIKAVTHLRNHISFILHSIHRRYPGIRMIVADDEYIGVGKEEWRRLSEVMDDLNVTYVQLVPRSGLSAGRNALVQACTTKYFVLLDDDVFFTASTRLELMVEALEAQPEVQIVAGAYAQYDSLKAAVTVDDYSLLFEPMAEKGAWRAYEAPPAEPGQCHRVQAAHNFFMARTDTLLRYQWHHKMSIFEHEHFFFQLYLAKQAILSCPHISVFHYRAANLHDHKYMAGSLRFKEHLYARHFCEAFPQVRLLEAPYWAYKCDTYELCPRWEQATGRGRKRSEPLPAPEDAMPCVSMVDPHLLTREAVTMAQPTSWSAAWSGTPSQRVVGSGATPPRPVLVLGEGGAGTGILSQLFSFHSQYLLWKEPKKWRFNSHMPDDLLAATLAALFRCEVSAEQLLMLHESAPQVEPIAHDESEDEPEQGGRRVEQSSADDEADEGKATTDDVKLDKRYSVAGANSSAPRFCGPGIASAVRITRFEAGLPEPLRRLPVHILVLVRHPVAIVTARIQAKKVQGAPSWPECTVATVARCARNLCGSMERMLRSLPAVGDRLKLLRWESFARRKTRVASDLLSWLGAGTNATALAATLREMDTDFKSFNVLPDKAPVSPRSRVVIEEQCSSVMSRLGYKPTAAAALLGRAGLEEHSTKRAAREATRAARASADNISSTSTSSSAAPTSVLLLKHSYDPSFLWCPIRLAATAPIFRFFARVRESAR